MSGRKREAPMEAVHPFDRTEVIPGVPELPVEATLVLPINQPRPEEVKTQAKPPKKRGLVMAAAAIIFIIVGAAWWVFRPQSGPPGAEALANPVPPSLQGYLQAANHGDAKAMRMLGASYTYGLGVRINRVEGAAWYRRAAEAGDKAAEQELQAISASQN